MQHKRTILALDDDEFNLMILIKTAEEAGYQVKPFDSGEAAWEYLRVHPGEVDIALLDKMIPGLSGFDLLKRIKQDESLKHIPVIFQTGDVGVEQMREGLENGAYYYLTKPFHPEILVAILHAADNECLLREELVAQMAASEGRFVQMMQDGEFLLTTHQEARLLAAVISQATEHPERTAHGLMELLANAIEHGNLEIGYEQKRELLLADRWKEELTARLISPHYAHRAVHVRLERVLSVLHVTIRDEGKGFDWWRQIEMAEREALNQPSGRGMSLAKSMLSNVRYVGVGNEVQCTLNLPEAHSKPENFSGYRQEILEWRQAPRGSL